MAKKIEKADPNGLSVILYYMIGGTELEEISDEGWDAYRDALALLATDFTVTEEEKMFKRLLSAGWSSKDGLKVNNWQEFAPSGFALQNG